MAQFVSDIAVFVLKRDVKLQLTTWHNHSGIFDEKRIVGVRLSCMGTFEGGALHCFCPRAPKTLDTPLNEWKNNVDWRIQV